MEARSWSQTAQDLLAQGAPFEDHWSAYQDAGMPPAWTPTPERVQRSHLGTLMTRVGVPDYDALWAWSVRDRAAYWGEVASALGTGLTEPVLDAGDVERAQWFPGQRWNAARHAMAGADEAPAILHAGEADATLRTITRAELRAMAAQVSNGLVAAGLGPGDAVALYMPMNAWCVAAYLGIVQAGMAVVSIPDSFAPPEVATRLRLGEAQLVITVASFSRGGKQVPMAPKAVEAAKQVGARVVSIGDADGCLAWDDFLGEARFTAQDVPVQALSNVLFSSGTTGEPKAIPWDHLTPLKCAADGRFHQDIHADDVVAWPTNIGWMMGPWLIYASLLNGAPMALYEGAPTTQGFVSFLRDAGVTMLGVVPAIVRAWHQAGLLAPGDLPDVRVFSSTGEASNAHDYLYLMSLAAYQAPVIEYCGGTEIGGGHLTGTVVQPATPATFTTAAMGLDFRILQDGQEVVGGHGELFLVPPSVGLSTRLLNRDHHEVYYAGTPADPRPGSADRVHGGVLRRHGDEVQVLENGWAAQGRADDTMNLGGIKVGSVELERVLDAHPAVQETAAIAVTPPGGGADRLVVFAVLVAGGAATDGLHNELQGRIKRALNPLFRIHDVVVVDALPRTASNKVMRRELRGQYGEKGERPVKQGQT